MKIFGWTSAVLCAISIFLIAGLASALKAGDKAPNFSAVGNDGKKYTLESFKGKPVVFYFIKDGCPINTKAAPYFTQIANSYKGKVQFVGIINGDKTVSDRWSKKFSADFLILHDPKQEIIKSYGAERSPWAHLVADGKIVQTWKGYSAGMLDAISEAMAKSGKIAAVKINTKGAPANSTAG